MAVLYITEQGAVLRKTGDRLIVKKDGETLLDVQCSKINAVLLFGNVQFTTQAVHELFQNGIEMAILSRTGKLVGHITSPFSKNIDLRKEQFRRHEDEGFRLGLSRLIVRAKIFNCVGLIRGFAYNHPEEELLGLADRLKDLAENTSAALDASSLLGVEGNAAREYFGAFGRMLLNKDFFFDGRKKHPATDPVNALLSLGYTLVFNEIASLLDGLGFDPYLGYCHSEEYGRASLASDIVEEFRASVDRFTLYLVNNRVLSPADFYNNPKGEDVYLKREAMKRYFIEYETNMNREFNNPETGENTTLRKSLRTQAEKLANHIKGVAEYSPFKLDI